MKEAHFIDTSALVKRYIRELGTEALLQRSFGDTDVEILVSSLTYAEVYATFSRLLNDGHLSVGQQRSLLASFEDDWASYVVVEFGANVRDQVADLARAYSLRVADLVQLASASFMQGQKALNLFVACDVRLANAATMAGMTVFNPELV